MAALPPELRERLVDRLRHAQQYAEAARLIAEGLAAFRGDEEVVGMSATRAGNVDERLGDRLRDVEQFAEAARRMAEDALDLVEAAKAEEPNDDGG